jgi:hypothetical protein
MFKTKHMKYRPLLYISLVAIAAVSFLGAWLLPVNDVAKTIAGLPFVGALFAALFQLIRDHSSFLKDTVKQQREHAFVVAATSHMSKVVFDKHVEFGEAYVDQLQQILGKLFAEGPTRRSVEFVYPLYQVRKDYRLWISSEMASTLDEFEQKIVRMGTTYGIAEAGSSSAFDKADKLYEEILDLKKKDADNPDIEIKKHQGYNLVIHHLQEILGVEKLTRLRDSIISQSFES